MEQTPPPFLDVHALLESSQARPRVPFVHFLVAGFVLAIVLSLTINHSGSSAASQGVLESLVGCVLMGFVGIVMMTAFVSIRRMRAEQSAVGAVDELVQLRRWPEAGIMLQGMLSQPARSPLARAQSLLYLAMVLARYHRFEDSVVVYDYILSHVPLDDATDHAVRLGRATALLREDNLLDADRAIAELRRTSRGVESAGLALVEIFRDVKTGHPAEAIEMFEKRLPIMRRQLSHRVADAYALAARAYDLLGRSQEAQAAFDNATLLTPLGELVRRYPEISSLQSKYRAFPAPAEVA